MNTSQKQLGFILGRDTAISIAEIFAYLKRLDVSPLSSLLINEVFLVEIEADDAKKININNLGGTIKIFEILGNFATQKEIIDELLGNIDYESEKRINFGISGYGNVNKNFVLKVGYEVKNSLANSDYSSRFVTGKHTDLSSVIVTENKLIERGFEAIILKNKDTYLLGKTIAVQDYKSYSKRDFGRPKRDARNGMLPPKLAQIMVNLAAKSLGSTIYDPFCGSGTIIQEALFLGYRDIYGSDIEKKNIEDTTENIDWLYRGFGLPKIGEENLFVSDVLEPAKSLSADAIVCEGYLGEPVKKSKHIAIKEAQGLSQFYTKALKNLSSMIRDDGIIVIAIPFFIADREYIYLPILDELEKLKLKQIDYIPRDINIRRFGRGNLTYSRPDQFVGREILILKKG